MRDLRMIRGRTMRGLCRTSRGDMDDIFSRSGT